MLARDGGRRKSESRKRVPPGKVVIIVEGILGRNLAGASLSSRDEVSFAVVCGGRNREER
jgi:hypothetical protein